MVQGLSPHLGRAAADGGAPAIEEVLGNQVADSRDRLS
jgi:hypothetical protein